MPPRGAEESTLQGMRICFVTGSLAAPSLRAVVAELERSLGFRGHVVVAKITVAALLTAEWLVGKLALPEGTSRVILPGWCGGDLQPLRQSLGGIVVERGPRDLRELPEFFQAKGGATPPAPSLERAHRAIDILAEINHADSLSPDRLFAEARRLRESGADVIDLGCSPGRPWRSIGPVVAELVAAGFRVSVDSFDPTEVVAATGAGAELVLSVHNGNLDRAADLGAEVVVIPEAHQAPDWLEQLERSAETLDRAGVPFRLDPVLDPIGFGFARSLGRYLATRARFPQARLLMGIGNLTELTEVDSAGVNALLIGFCQEVGIESVLTTEVIPWAAGSVREAALAAWLMQAAAERHALPKHLGAGLVQLRDVKRTTQSRAEIERLHAAIRDPNFRIFAEEGEIFVLNHALLERGTDPFALFERLGVRDPGHAFYLGWEMMKAATALQLGKRYTQDQALPFGVLTRPESSHRRHSAPRPSGEPKRGSP